MNTTSLTPRTGGQILVDQLVLHGVQHIFCVPGESYLAVLDALHDADIGVTVCRQEGGAAMMAEAQGKLTGQPGICFVTRGPGATNASAGIHIAHQDSTPMILFVGQVARVFGDYADVLLSVDSRSAVDVIVERSSARGIASYRSRAWTRAWTSSCRSTSGCSRACRWAGCGGWTRC